MLVSFLNCIKSFFQVQDRGKVQDWNKIVETDKLVDDDKIVLIVETIIFVFW